jgi:hypothetical protein
VWEFEQERIDKGGDSVILESANNLAPAIVLNYTALQVCLSVKPTLLVIKFQSMVCAIVGTSPHPSSALTPTP